MRSSHILYNIATILLSFQYLAGAFTNLSLPSGHGNIRNSILNRAPAQLNPRSTLRISPNSEFEDFQSNNDDSSLEGQELARQFYKQVEQRKRANKSIDQEQYEMKNDLNDGDDNSKKFTGRRGEIDSTGTPSAGLFARGNGSVYAFPVERRGGRGRSTSSDVLSARDRMMEKEINFMNFASNEVTIVLQGILVVILLVFAVYVGISGGITDGSERFSGAEEFMYEVNDRSESVDFSGFGLPDSVGIVNQDSVWL